MDFSVLSKKIKNVITTAKRNMNKMVSFENKRKVKDLGSQRASTRWHLESKPLSLSGRLVTYCCVIIQPHQLPVLPSVCSGLTVPESESGLSSIWSHSSPR